MTAAERAFRVLLALYPAPFRLAYGDLMTQLFLDQLRDAREGRARRGVAATWLATFADLGRSSVDERLHGDRELARSIGEPPAILDWLLGLLGVVGGLVLVSAFVVVIPVALNVGRLVLFNLGAVAIAIATYRLIRRDATALTRALTAFVIAANAVYAVLTIWTSQFDAPFGEGRALIYSWTALAMWASDALFALVAVRLGGMARAGALGLALGALAILGMDFFFEVNDATGSLALGGIFLNGVGWIILGLVVARRRRAPEAAAAAHVPIS